jgi:hypothetical protein
MLGDDHGPQESAVLRFLLFFKVQLPTLVIHNVIYYNLLFTVNYNTFRLAVYPTCFDI